MLPRYWGIFWIDASSDDSIKQSFTQIARILRTDMDGNTTVERVKRQLANTSQSWLLIFDNADNPDLSLTPFFPTGDRGDVIITSRNPSCSVYNTVGCKEIGRMSPSDSTALLVLQVLTTNF